MAKKKQDDGGAPPEERPTKTAITRERTPYTGDPALDESPSLVEEAAMSEDSSSSESPAPLTWSQRLSTIIPSIPGDVLVGMLEQHHFGFLNDKLALEQRLARLERHILGKTLGPGE